MTQPKPTITGTTHTLPFHQLSPRDFERLCLWLVEREGFDRAEQLGATGRDQGRDIVAWRGDQLWAFQCKRVQHFGPKDAETEVDKVLGLPEDLRPVALVFLVACDVSDETRNRARARCGAQMACHFWALTKLDERVNRHNDILEEFFRLAPLEPLPPLLHQLPADLADFTGREAEFCQLLDLLTAKTPEPTAAAISSIGGMGGIGKTTLAVHVAHRLLHRYPDAQIVVDLGGTTDRPLAPEEAMCQVVHAFQPKLRLPADPQALAALYRSTLSGRRALILFDDAADGAQVRPLLPPAPCGVAVTSRRSIALAGMSSFNLDVLSEDEARTLLREILGAERATRAELDQIARLCGRLPLALRVAGSFLAVHADWTPAEYTQTLSDERDRLARLVHEDLDVRAALGLSAAQLVRDRPDLVAAWQMLSIFPAPFDRAAAAAVWDVDEPNARDRLSELTVRSLLLYDQDKRLHHLHVLMRPVARDALAYGTGERESGAERLMESTLRYAAHYLELGARAYDLYEQGGAHVMDGLRQLHTAWPHLQAIFGWPHALAALARVPGRGGEPAARWMGHFFVQMSSLLALRLPPRDWIPFPQAPPSAPRPLGDFRCEDIHLSPLSNLDWPHANLEDTRRAIRSLEQALEIARQIGDRSIEGNALGSLGNAYLNLREVPKAIGYFEQALEIACQVGDRRWEEICLGSLGLAYFALGDVHKVIGIFNQALEIARQVGDRRGEGTALGNLGLAYRHLAEPRKAIDCHQQALEINRGISDRRGQGDNLGNLGNAYADLGKPRRSIEYYAQSLEIAREISDQCGEGVCLGNLGSAYLASGEPQPAIDYCEQALEIARQISDWGTEGNALANLGHAYAGLGEVRRAIKHYEQTLDIARQIGHRYLEANTLFNLGLLARDQGDTVRARQIWDQALRIYEAIEHPSAQRVRGWLADLERRGEPGVTD